MGLHLAVCAGVHGRPYVEADFDPIPFDAAHACAFGRAAAELRASGRNTNAVEYDALIAATADPALPVCTRYLADFAGIDVGP